MSEKVLEAVTNNKFIAAAAIALLTAMVVQYGQSVAVKQRVEQIDAQGSHAFQGYIRAEQTRHENEVRYQERVDQIFRWMEEERKKK